LFAASLIWFTLFAIIDDASMMLAALRAALRASPMPYGYARFAARRDSSPFCRRLTPVRPLQFTYFFFAARSASYAGLRRHCRVMLDSVPQHTPCSLMSFCCYDAAARRR